TGAVPGTRRSTHHPPDRAAPVPAPGGRARVRAILPCAARVRRAGDRLPAPERRSRPARRLGRRHPDRLSRPPGRATPRGPRGRGPPPRPGTPAAAVRAERGGPRPGGRGARARDEPPDAPAPAARGGDDVSRGAHPGPPRLGAAPPGRRPAGRGRGGVPAGLRGPERLPAGLPAVVWALTAGRAPHLLRGWLSSATRNLSLATLVRHRDRCYL